MGFQALPTYRPYEHDYIRLFTAKDGTRFRIRPIRPADETLMVRFHASLSRDTVYSRYFEVFALAARTAHDRLLRICRPDPKTEVVLVAEQTLEGQREIVAVGRLVRSEAGGQSAEFALLVGDSWQGRGLGSELLRHLVLVASAKGLRQVWAEMLGANQVMRRTALAAGFTLIDDPVAFTTRAELTLR